MISATRLVAVVPCVVAILEQAWLVASVCFVYAVASDFGDGAVARRRGEVSAFGGLLDHGADAVFVTATLGAFAALEQIPWLLPPLIAAAFLQYVWDSAALSGAPLRASMLGRWNGIAYYALSGWLSVGHALIPGASIERVGNAAGWLLAASTAASMADRALALWRLRR